MFANTNTQTPTAPTTSDMRPGDRTTTTAESLSRMLALVLTGVVLLVLLALAAVLRGPVGTSRAAVTVSTATASTLDDVTNQGSVYRGQVAQGSATPVPNRYRAHGAYGEDGEVAAG